MRWVIGRTWDGVALSEGAVAVVEVDERGVTVEAMGFGDPPPELPPGRHARLWEHEVVEVFLAEGRTSDSRYVEVEVGPHGHWLVLAFEGERRLVSGCEDRVLGYRVEPGAHGWWRGRLELEPGWWGEVVRRAVFGNAYAVHGFLGSGVEARRFCASHPAPAGQARPDFHRLEGFERI